MKRTVSEDVKHRRAVQGALSIGTATIGLAALGAKGGSMALKKYPKTMKSVRGLPSKIRNVNSDSLNSASVTLTTGGAGLGGASGYHFAALQRAENKAEKEREGRVYKSAFGPVHKADSAQAGEYALYGGGLAGAAGGLAASDIRRGIVGYRLKREIKPRAKELKVQGKKVMRLQAKADAASMSRDWSKPGVAATAQQRAKNIKRADKMASRAGSAARSTAKDQARLLKDAKKIKSLPTAKVRAIALGAGGASVLGGLGLREYRKDRAI